MKKRADLKSDSDLRQRRRTSRFDGAEVLCSINNVASVRVLAPSLSWRRRGVLAFIFSMFMFLDKRSCINQTASFCRAGSRVW